VTENQSAEHRDRITSNNEGAHAIPQRLAGFPKGKTMSGLHLPMTFALGDRCRFSESDFRLRSMLTRIFLVMLGLDIDVANATNRIIGFCLNMTAAAPFHKDGCASVRYSLSLGIPTTDWNLSRDGLRHRTDENDASHRGNNHHNFPSHC
jgi:hypothetical protein